MLAVAKQNLAVDDRGRNAARALHEPSRACRHRSLSEFDVPRSLNTAEMIDLVLVHLSDAMQKGLHLWNVKRCMLLDDIDIGRSEVMDQVPDDSR